MSGTFTRERPSPRYLELLAQYRSMHVEGEKSAGVSAADTFPGKSLAPQAVRIKQCIDATRAANLLDYGSGKGTQYLPGALEGGAVRGFDSVQDYWGVDFIQCYDPGHLPYCTLPVGQFDGVICTDVLEHCPEQDLPWIIGELFGYAGLFVFASVAVYPADKHLPNGENAHATIRDPLWWYGLFSAVAKAKTALTWEVWLDHRDAQPDGSFVRREVAIGSAHPLPADTAS